MDHILIYGKSIEEHDSHLDGVLDTVQHSGLKLNKAKCEFRKEELGFFAHRVGKDGIKPDPEKVRTIIDRILRTTQFQKRKNRQEERLIEEIHNY